MTDLRKAAELALEALELECTDINGDKVDLVTPAIAAIRQALEQPEQEPVAWSVLDKRRGKHWYTHESKYTAQYYANLYSHREPDGSPSMEVTPLYTAPPKREWQGLTDEELRHAYGEVSGNEWCLGGISNAETFCDIIEAKLKEKNRG